MRVLFLTGQENPLYNVHRNMVDGVHATEFFSSSSFSWRLLRRLMIKVKRSSLTFSLGDWLGKTSDFDIIIISGTIYSYEIANILISRGLKKKLVHWFWNPITKSDRIDLMLKQDVPIYTFDPSDSSRYGLRLETTYYFRSLCKNPYLDKIPEIDVFFVGGDKGRLDLLLNFESTLTAAGLTSYFHIVDTKNRPVISNYKFKTPITYEKVLDLVFKSRCLLDFVQQGQSGLTQRPMEALFHRRKLITNDLTIVKQDFYSSDNIFVLGIDNINKLAEFVSTPLKDINQEIIDKYDFSNWIIRMKSSLA